MKTSLTLLITIVLIFTSKLIIAQDVTKDVNTTYYLIRHAEKDRSDKTNKNPHLNKNGKIRAERWAAYFKDKNLNAIYSTNYNRTQETAKPTAETFKLKVLDYNPNNMYSDSFKMATQGKTVLIVGHSNTTPYFSNLILEKDMFKNMSDDDNSSLYIINIKGDKKEVKVITVN